MKPFFNSIHEAALPALASIGPAARLFSGYEGSKNLAEYFNLKQLIFFFPFPEAQQEGMPSIAHDK